MSESERRFRALVEQAAFGVAVADLEGRFVEANEALERMLGYGPNELTGRHIRDITAPEDADRNVRLLHELVAGERDAYRIEKRYVRKDGSTIWALVSTTLVREEDGSPSFVLGTVVDIDDRKQAEERLHEAEHRYRTLVEQLPLVTYIDALDDRSSNIYTSPQLEPVLGYTAAEWQADPDLFVTLLHPEDRNRVLEEISESGDRFASEYRLIARDGREVWFRDESVTVYDRSGTPSHAQGYLLDITERKRAEETVRESEERFRSLADDAPVLIWTADPDANVTFFSKGWLEFTGQSPEQQLGTGWVESVHPDDVEAAVDLYHEAIRSGVSYEAEYRLRRADGQYRWIHDRGKPRILDDGSLAGYVGIGIDVTEQRVAAEALERRDRVLEAVGRIAEGLLRASTWDEVDIVGPLGEAAGASRAFLVRNRVGEDGSLRWTQCAEWVADGAQPANGDGLLEDVGYDESGFSRWATLLAAGEIVGGPASGLPQEESAALARTGVRSILTVPIFVDRAWWGSLGFVDSVAERLWGDAEVDALRTVASAVGETVQRQHASQSLRESEARFTAFMNNTPASAFMKDEAGRYVFANEPLARTVGTQPSALVGRTDPELFSDETARDFQVTDELVRASGQPVERIERQMGSDGRVRHWYSLKFPFDEAGGRRFVGGVSFDVTEREEAREALQETKNALEAVVDSSPLPIVTYDRDGTVIGWSAAAGQTFGWAADEVLGRPNPLLPESERARFQEAIDDALAGKSWRSREVQRLHKDGTLLDVALSSAPLRDAEGEAVGMVVMLADISERKRSETRAAAQHDMTRALAESTTDEEAGWRILRALCNGGLGWELGSLWLVDRETGLLRYATGWNERSDQLDAFAAASAARTFDLGVGLPGRVWRSRQPFWIDDLANDPDFPRASWAAAAGLHSGFAVPVASGGEVLGVLELFGSSSREPEPEIQELILAVGGQLEQFLRRTEAERALREREERFRTLVANVPGIIYRCAADADWTMEFMSDAVCDLTGYPASDFSRNGVRTYASIVHPDDLPDVARLVDEAVRRKQPFELEYRVVAAGGEIRWVSEKGQPIIGPGSEVLWLDGAIFDVTRQKQAETELGKERELMRLFMESTPDHVFFKDRESRFLRISTALALRFGLDDPADAIGKTDFDFFAREHAERALADEQWLLETGEEMLNAEYKETWPDGAESWVAVWRLPLRDEHGAIVGTFGIARDITQRKRGELELAEAKGLLDSIVENLPTPLFLKDAEELRFVRVNRAAEELWGIDRDALIGKSDRDFFPTEQAEFFVRKDREVVDGQQLLDIPDEPIETLYLGTRYLHTRKVPIVDDAGRSQYLLGISLDITDSKLTQRRLAEQNEQLRQLDRMKDEFVALVSHELRTPLTSILGYLELLIEGEAGEITKSQENFLGIIERNAQRLLRLVGDLLFVAQIEAGKLSIERDAVNLLALARDCIEAQQPRADEKRIELRLDGAAVVGLRADRVRIAQLLDNLVSNAIKFTPEGGNVSVRLSHEDDHALVTVSDTGMGIPKEEQSRLFERFFRTSGATRRAIQGTGLGLTITKAIVEAHGGSIAVKSEHGKGTTFLVDLPFGDAISTRAEPVPIDVDGHTR